MGRARNGRVLPFVRCWWGGQAGRHFEMMRSKLRLRCAVLCARLYVYMCLICEYRVLAGNGRDLLCVCGFQRILIQLFSLSRTTTTTTTTMTTHGGTPNPYIDVHVVCRDNARVPKKGSGQGRCCCYEDFNAAMCTHTFIISLPFPFSAHRLSTTTD